MRNFKFIKAFNRISYVLIALIFINHIACTTNNPKKEISPASMVPNEPVTSSATDGKQNQKTEHLSRISSDKLAWAQLNLELLGYSPGNVQGKLTAQTQTALAKFQKKSGLPVTGSLEPSTFQALEQAVAVQSKRLSQPPRKTVRLRPPSDVPPTKPSVIVTQNQPTTLFFTNIQAVGVYRVAAYLAEAGYFQGPIKYAQLDMVEAALKTFQLDIGVKPRGILDGTTWNKLQSVGLSYARKAELEAAIANDKRN